jgi:hypothetical protein
VVGLSCSRKLPGQYLRLGGDPAIPSVHTLSHCSVPYSLCSLQCCQINHKYVLSLSGNFRGLCILIWLHIIMTCNLLWAGWFGTRVPAETRFCTHPDGPEGLPSLLFARYRMFSGCKAAGCVVNHPPASCTKVRERVEQCL